jgi:hypothetical protein
MYTPHFIKRPVPRQDNGYVYTNILLNGLFQGRTMVIYTPHFIKRPEPRQDNGGTGL